jgi:hypothetical protein
LLFLASLVNNYIKSYGHLIPPGVEIWEYDICSLYDKDKIGRDSCERAAPRGIGRRRNYASGNFDGPTEFPRSPAYGGDRD